MRVAFVFEVFRTDADDVPLTRPASVSTDPTVPARISLTA
jgi:hypothetical protein